VPIDIYGERAGNPTTLRDIIKDKALKFWDEKVNEEGKVSGWGGRPRHEHLYGKVVRDEFEKAIRANVKEVVAAFKAKMKHHFANLTEKHIEDMIKQ